MFLFEFHSSNATSIAEIDSDGKVWTDNETDPVFKEDVSDTAKSLEFHRVQGFYAQARAFVDAVKSRKQLHNNLRDGVESMRLADRILAEAENG
jgi:predicted dehydrogenase